MTVRRRAPCPTPDRRVYPSREAAERRAPAAEQRGGDVAPLFPYECDCGRWHMGEEAEPNGPREGCPTPDKIGFATEEMARKRAMVLSGLRGVDLYVYGDCPCGWWHLTRQRHDPAP
jgi:hypothetical protein